MHTNALYDPTRESAIFWQTHAHHRAADAVLALHVGDVQGAIEAQVDAAQCAVRAMERLNRLQRRSALDGRRRRSALDTHHRNPVIRNPTSPLQGSSDDQFP